MARRTKEDALLTRNKLLDAAEYLFQSQGVSRTSLQDIAQRAGATRGAVYWHFTDKADLFNAMIERVSLPLEAAFFDDENLHPNLSSINVDALAKLRRATVEALDRIVNDAQTRRVFEVATQKVEYVDELRIVRERHLAIRQNFVIHCEQSIESAAQRAGVPLPIHAASAARGFHALIDGLIQNWLLDQNAFDLLDVGQRAMNTYLKGLGFSDAPSESTDIAFGPE